MKSFIASTVAILALSASTLASPQYRRQTASDEAVVQLTDDKSGKNTNSPVPLDSAPHAIAQFFDGTAIDQNGQFLATSAMIVGGLEFNPICNIVDSDGTNLLQKNQLDSQVTFSNIIPNNGNGTLVEVDLVDAFIICSF